MNILNYCLIVILSIIIILLSIIFKYIYNLSFSGNKLNNKLDENDIYIITNDFCKCHDIKIYNISFKIKCNLCKIRRIINFEKEESVYYFLENIKNNVKLLIHTEGGKSEFPDFLAYILKQHNVNIETFIPQFATSAGSFMALSSNIIHMNWYSCMSPIDTQIEYNSDSDDESFPAKYIKNVKNKENAITRLKAMESEGYHQDDIFIINNIFKSNKKRKLIKKYFLDTKLSHSIKYGPKDLKKYGLNIKIGIPDNINKIFNEFKKLSMEI